MTKHSQLIIYAVVLILHTSIYIVGAELVLLCFLALTNPGVRNIFHTCALRGATMCEMCLVRI